MSASVSTSSLGGTVIGKQSEHLRYPLHLDINEIEAADGSFTLDTVAHLADEEAISHKLFGMTLHSPNPRNIVDSTDTLDFNASGNFVACSGQKSAQTFAFNDSLGGCYRANVASLSGAVSSYATGTG